MTLIDVTPISFGLETKGGKMSIIIPKGTKIPTNFSKQYTTSDDYQHTVALKVFEGENSMTKDNKKLG